MRSRSRFSTTLALCRAQRVSAPSCALSIRLSSMSGARSARRRAASAIACGVRSSRRPRRAVNTSVCSRRVRPSAASMKSFRSARSCADSWPRPQRRWHGRRAWERRLRSGKGPSRQECKCPRTSAMPFAPKLKAHGAEIPAIGFGTSGMGYVTAEHVATALKAGYRHIDTARKYGTEPAVGEGMRGSGLGRHYILICTKVSHENLHAGDFARSFDESLRALGVDYVDLLLVHWPEKNTPLAETMGALAKAKQTGLARHIGVANFNIAMLDEAIRLCPEPLVTLQAECHPYLDQTKVVEACRQRGLGLTAYCPHGRGRLHGDPVLTEIGKRKGKTFAQVALRWLMQQGVIAAIPRSSNAARIAQNIDVFAFELSDDDMRRIGALKRADGRIANPVGRAPQWDV